MLSKTAAQEILEARGFVQEGSSEFGESFKLELGNGWTVTAYCTFDGNPFSGKVNKENYEDVDIHLHDMIGTSHICTSEGALHKNLIKIVDILRSNSDDDEILKCPKCKVRYVNPKTPTEGQKWKPFLSCSGMQIVGKGKNKDVLCNGVSKRLPAVVEY